MHTKKYRRKAMILCIPGFVGFSIFYLIPFVKSLRYAFINDTFHKEFVWFSNFSEILKNKYFQLALRNTVIFSLVGVFLLLTLSFFLTLGLSSVVRKSEIIKNAFLLPMLLPTISTIFVWRAVFDSDLYFSWMKTGNGFLEVLPIYILFLWKNTGINVILFTAAFSQLPEAVYDAAALDGAKGFNRLRYITLPLITPTAFFVAILSLVNSMKVFKESFLFFETGYPPDAAYTVQYYMNNHFQKLHYQNLACASTIVAVLIGILICVVYRMQNRYMRDVSL